MVIDASPVNIIDVTAVQKIDELWEQLVARGIVLAVASRKRSLHRIFEGQWVDARRELTKDHDFPP